MREVTVIQARMKHASTITGIGKSAFRCGFEQLFNSREELQQYPDHTYDFAKLTATLGKENNIYFLAVLDERPAGFAKLKKHSLNQQIESFDLTELKNSKLKTQNS